MRRVKTLKHQITRRNVAAVSGIAAVILGSLANLDGNAQVLRGVSPAEGNDADLSKRVGIYGPWLERWLQSSRLARRLLSKPYTVKQAEIPKHVKPVLAVIDQKLPSLAAEERGELAVLFVDLCRKYRFSPAMVLGLIEVESSFRPLVESGKGAVGLMQLLPSTAAPLAKELGLPWNGAESLRDPKFNLRLGFHYLAYLRSRFQERSHYVTAYNWGPTRVSQMISQREQLPLGYFQKIQRLQKNYAALDRNPGL